MPADILAAASALAETASYNYHAKEAWKGAGRKVLRQLAKDLGLAKGTYEVRVCEGGIAVSGECILHSDSLYVCLTDGSVCGDAGYARRVASRRDYCGERNISVPRRYDDLLRIARQIIDPSLPADQIRG